MFSQLNPTSSGWPLIETCIVNGTIRLLYDLTRGATVAGGACTVWAPVIGGTAADVLVPPDTAPSYTSNSTYFGGNRPCITGNGSTQYLQSTTPASAVQVDQTFQVVCFGKPPTTSGAHKYMWDTANAAVGIEASGSKNGSNNWGLWAGSWADSGIATDSSQGVNLTATYDDTASIMRARKADGTLASTGTLNTDINSIQGVTLLSAYEGSFPSDGSISAFMLVTGLSAADQARLDAWAHAVMRWS